MAQDYEALIRAIDSAEESAYGSENDSQLSSIRSQAIDYYLGENTNPAPEGRSQIVDRTVFETIESIIPSLVRIFASGDDVCKVLPVGPDDDNAAMQTTALLQWTITEKNPWEQTLHDWAKDSLLLANGYCLAYWDKAERVERETYEGQSDEQIALITQDKNVRVLQHSERPDEEENERRAQQYQQAVQQYQMMQQQAAMQAQQTGQIPQLPPPPQPPQPAMLHDVVIERVESEGKACIQVLPPEHCKVAFDTPDFTLRSCNYFEFWQEKPISELRAMGLEVPDDISDHDDTDTEEDNSRDRFNEDEWLESEIDPSMRKVKVRMIWIRCDLEGDGIARLYYVIRVGSEILYVEPVSRIPVASMCPMPLPHRHIGLSIFDVSKDLQDTKTAIRRGALDSLYLANSARYAISDQVNLEDMLVSRPGGLVRLMPGAKPADGHIFPLTHPFVFDQVIGSLSYFDQLTQTRTGISQVFNGTESNVINKTASGQAMLATQSAQRVEQIARMFAIGVEYLFSCVLELLQKHANKEQTFQLRGQWFAVPPTAWSTKRDLKISVGVGAGNKDAMLAQLQGMFAAQMQTLPLGIATPQTLYATALEIAKLQGFSSPEKFWADPAKQPPQQPQPPLPLVIEQAKQQGEAQKAQFEAQVEAQKSQQEMAFEKWKAEQDLALEKWKAELDAQTKIAIEQMRTGTSKEIKAAELMSEHSILEAGNERKSDSRIERDYEDMIDRKALESLEEQIKLMMRQVNEVHQMYQQAATAQQQIAQSLTGGKVVGVQKIKGPDGRMRAARVARADGSVDEVPIQ